MEYADAEFLSAAEKGKVFRAWNKFLSKLADGTMEEKDFTETLYHHLMQHCSFIAHYDRHGFFSTYFADPEDTPDFFQQFDKDKEYRSFEYGNAMWFDYEPYKDLNKDMCNAFERYKKRIYENSNAQLKEQTLAEIERLKKKAGMIGTTVHQQNLSGDKMGHADDSIYEDQDDEETDDMDEPPWEDEEQLNEDGEIEASEETEVQKKNKEDKAQMKLGSF